MFYYIYDGTFDGLLTAFKTAFENKDTPEDIVSESNFDGGLFSEKFLVQTDEEKSEIFSHEIREKAGNEVFMQVLAGFLSEIKGVEKIIFDYLKLAFAVGPNVKSRLAENSVLALRKICQKVTFEAHRLKGLIRFQELKDGLFYAAIEPDHQILELIAPHFARRFRAQRWIIHDKKRNLAIIYDLRNYRIVDMESRSDDLKKFVEEGETEYQELWKAYFKAIAIPERKNPRLQRQFMPRRYWKYLPEKAE